MHCLRAPFSVFVLLDVVVGYARAMGRNGTQWYFVHPDKGHDVLTFLGILSNTVYSNSHPEAIGAGSYIGNQDWRKPVRLSDA